MKSPSRIRRGQQPTVVSLLWILIACVSIVCSNRTISRTGKIDMNGNGFSPGKLNATDGDGPGRWAGFQKWLESNNRR